MVRKEQSIVAEQGVTPQTEDFPRWYTDVVQKADLADYSPVRGCMIIKPYGYELWEAVKSGLDTRFKATGHQNAYFPLFIPESFLKKEAEHVEGFAPELAVVTIGGGKELEEPLIVRPTSETIIGWAFQKWIQSHRDLPLLINQWANVVRWELRTRLFLRTMEFLWQEGHTAHATHEDAIEETMRMLGVYADFAIADAAIPVIQGRKSQQERFAGAVNSYAIEAMMRDGKALQAGTSHDLGQNFAKAFEIQYTDENNALQFCWTTSWGLSTRMVGAIVMTHGDDMGLRLPPKVAPIQVVIVPIFRKDAEQGPVMEAVDRIAAELRLVGVRVHVDDRDHMSPGFKFNDWEMRGVPLRLEIGPKDIEKNSVALARRDVAGKAGKEFVSQEGVIETVLDWLDDIQAGLFEQAAEFRDSHLYEITSNYADFTAVINRGEWALSWFCGGADCETRVKADTSAVSRVFPLDQPYPGESGTCIICGEHADEMAYFAKAY
jgi:prolyl-tRNA synthetase